MNSSKSRLDTIERAEQAPKIWEDKEGHLYIDGNPSEVKESVLDWLKGRVIYLSQGQYEEKFGNRRLANFKGRSGKGENGRVIKQAEIYINRDAFFINGQDYSDLIPIVLRHELEEIWTYLEADYDPDRKSEKMSMDSAHNLALRKEYEFAFGIGKANRYAQFIIDHLRENSSLSLEDKKRVFAENKKAYDEIRSSRSKNK